MLIASIFEIFSLGAVIPFLKVLASPSDVNEFEYLQTLLNFFSLSDPNEVVFFTTILFITLIIFSTLIRLALLFFMTKFSYSLGADLSVDIYRRTLHQDYKVHLMRNSSEVINGIVVKTSAVIGGVIMPIMHLSSSILFSFSIMLTLLYFKPYVAIISFLLFGILYLIVITLVKKRLSKNSEIIAKNSNNIIKSLQEGLGSIRDVLLNRSQEFYCNLYKDSDKPLRNASGINDFLNGSPRFLMESIGMILIVSIAYFLTLDGNTNSEIFPMLGLLALGAQRLLPLMQKIYSSIASLIGAHKSLADIIELLTQDLSQGDEGSLSNLKFENSIELENVSFNYPGSLKLVIEEFNLIIPKGKKVGFIGYTGCGKSTLLDIIMSLNIPTKGKLLVDGVEIKRSNKYAWRKHIALVPQNIFLSDASIKENIALGSKISEINTKKVQSCIKKAQLDSFIKSLPDGIETNVGENGAKISGGQKQRLGIARALYKNSSVLILDEATSALDHETEKAVMNSIEKLDSNITLLIIAHRLSTLKNCDFIVKIDKDYKYSIVNFKELNER